MWSRLSLWLLPALGYAAMRGLRQTLRLRTLHAERVESLWGAGKNVIIAFWHGRQVMMPWVYTRREMAGSKIQVLVSEHRDGELIARILQWFGFGTARGSTTRGGTRALRQMMRAGRSGQDLAVTPDGPRGPRCVAQRGVIQLAKLTGLPIAPVTFAASKKKLFGSWDRFELPLPFCRACFLWGELIWVSREADAVEIEAKRMELETALKQLDKQADRLVGDDSEKGSGTGRDLPGSLMFAIYNIGLVLASPLIIGIMLAKPRCREGMAQRLGWLPQSLAGDRRDAPTIWVHAVSMGEVNAVVPLVQELKARYPEHRVVVSTVTETGKETMLRHLEGVAQHLYFPFDFRFVVRKALRTMRPCLFLVVETELWPNFLREAAHRGVPCVLVNGRLSTDSFHGYLRLRPFFRRILQAFSLCLMQTDRDVERIVRLGADPSRVVRTGNLKFDQQIAPDFQPIALGLEAGEELFVAGSTHPAEEEVVVDCYRRLLEITPCLVLVIAPRHIERAEAVAAMVRAKGLIPLRKTMLRSNPEGRSPSPEGGSYRPRVIILDTRGDLAALYQQATLVFVGGSLVPLGGHSPVEPALWGKAVVFGSHMDHFAELANLLVSQGGAIQVSDGEELMTAMAALLKDRGRLTDMGRIAAQIVEAQQGTVAKNAELIAQLLEQGRATAHEPQ